MKKPRTPNRPASKSPGKSGTKSSAAIRPVRVAVVGLGMGQYHIERFRELDPAICDLTAICDTDEKRLRSAGERFGIKPENCFTSLDRMLRQLDGSLDAVALAVPNVLHEPMTLTCFEAGLHVLCEKPLSTTAASARRMVDAAKKAKRFLALHYNTRMSPQHAIVRAMYERGAFGKIQHIRAGWVRQRGIPVGAAGWFLRKDMAGGGTLIDTGVHMIDASLWACGFPKVRTVTGQTWQAFTDRDVPAGMKMDVEDGATAFLRCEGEITMAIEQFWASHVRDRERVYVSVMGTKAGAHWSWVKDEPQWQRTLDITRCSPEGALTCEHITEYPPDSMTVQRDFVEALRAGREPLCTGEQGLALMRILDAIYESSRTGREVALSH